MKYFTKIFCVVALLTLGAVSVHAQYEEVALTQDMFLTWDGYGADASSTGEATVDFNIGTDVELNNGSMVCGTGTVDYLIYADLTGSVKMIIEGTAGVQLRVLLNRQESNNGPLVEKNPVIGEDGTVELDLTEFDYVHLNAIKTGWGSPAGKVNAIKLLKPSTQPQNVTLAQDMFFTWDGYGADASSLGQATVEFNIGTDVELNAGGMVCGTSTVDYLTYADLTGSTTMIIEGTAGVQLRVLLNRQESNNGPLVEKNPVIGEDGTVELDLTDLDYVHLNAIKLGWGSPAGKVNAITLVKPSDPLAGLKENLKNEISKGKQYNSFAKTAESFGALTDAIAAAEAEIDNASATAESIAAAKQAIEDAIEGLELEEGYTVLTADMFKKYASVTEPGEGTTAYPAYELFKTSDLPFGDGNVGELNWADLTDYDQLIVVTKGDVKPRFCMNRLEAGGQQAATQEDSKMLDINSNNDFTWSTEKYQTIEGNVYTIDLTKIVADYEFARLHCIKKQGWGTGVFITDLLLFKKAEPVPATHTWDFTQWSEETVANLKAEAAKVTVEDDTDNPGKTKCTDNGALWSDHEKVNKCETYEASKDNCFWYVGGEAEPTANGEAIAEFDGLEFNTSYGASRALAIAVNYPSTSLGTYNGPAYLWFGGKNQTVLTIKNVKPGTTITMGVESHKSSDARGVKLFLDDNELTDPEGAAVAAPKTYTEQTWQVPVVDSEVVDIVVKNTNGCHIYFIDAEIGESGTVGINTVETSTVANDAIYNLAGQRVAQPAKGLFIINGKKVVIK